MTPLFQVQDWRPELHPLITEWRRVRGVREVPAMLVPPNAIVLFRDGSPVAFAALFVTVPREGGASVGWCEFFTTAPGLSLRETRECASHVMEFFRAVARESRVSALIAFCSGGVKRVLLGLGMSEHGGGLDCLIEFLEA